MLFPKLFLQVRLVLLALAMLLCAAPTHFAQSATGGIRGAVTDTNGAALPNATVAAKNTATGLDLRTTTNSEGIYAFPRILPGKYTVTVEV